jgi:hypothetical protein
LGPTEDELKRELLGPELCRFSDAGDQAVNTLFTTTDAIELQRAMFLIRRLDCKISTRL